MPSKKSFFSISVNCWGYTGYLLSFRFTHPLLYAYICFAITPFICHMHQFQFGGQINIHVFLCSKCSYFRTTMQFLSENRWWDNNFQISDIIKLVTALFGPIWAGLNSFQVHVGDITSVMLLSISFCKMANSVGFWLPGFLIFFYSLR